MATKLVEKREELNAKREALAKIFERYPNLDMPAEVAADIKARNDELSRLGEEYETLKLIASAKEANDAELRRLNDPAPGPGMIHPGDRNTPAARANDRTSIGQLFTGSQAYKGYRGGGNGPIAAVKIPEIKTLFQTTAGWAPETTRTGLVVPFATRPIAVVDLIPQGETTQNAVVYMEETTYTNAAAETAEAGAYPEAALALTERSEPVRKISVFLPVTDEQLADEPQARAYVDNRLGYMLRQRLDSQILVGNGTPPNLQGILNRSGLQTQAKGGDPTPDAVYKAMTLIMANAFADPDATIWHPLDWQDVRLLRTTDGIYIWGSPSEPGPDRIWGLPVTRTTAIPQNTALVGAFQEFSALAVRQDVEFQISNSHEDYFTRGKQAIRADIRVALQVYRPAAFASVTGV
jgi:HK97 family phage major capsid protein